MPYSILDLLQFSVAGESRFNKVQFAVLESGDGVLSEIGHASPACGSDYNSCEDFESTTTSATTSTTTTTTTMNNLTTTETMFSLLPDCKFAPFHASPTPSPKPITNQQTSPIIIQSTITSISSNL
jgi:hypothetical protein